MNKREQPKKTKSSSPDKLVKAGKKAGATLSEEDLKKASGGAFMKVKLTD